MSDIERTNLPATRPAPPPAIRDNPLMALRQAIMVLDDQRAALVERGDPFLPEGDVLPVCGDPCWEDGPKCQLAPGHPGHHHHMAVLL